MYRPFCKEILQKPIDQITEQDLVGYFQQERDETLFLEFKSYTDRAEDNRGRDAKAAEKVRGVVKAISAFLNSSGGLVIWGAPESVEVSRDKKKVKICQGALAPVPTYYDRDAFISKIVSQISPLPQGIRMQPIEVGGGYVYLFEMGESQNKPHQFDGRYYVRTDTRTDAAPHHWVYALCRQVRVPELALNLKANPSLNSIHDENITFSVIAEIQNTTELVNDYDIYFKAQTLNGGIKKSHLGDAASSLLFADVTKILSHGLPVELTFFIDIKKQRYPEGQPSITIWFGGKNSIVKKVSHQVIFSDRPRSVDYTNTTFSYDVILKPIADSVVDLSVETT